jgi:3-(3-hydroxy-phenyl)propionate hydroxylase
MTGHAVVIAGGGPTGMMLAGELTLAGIDVLIVERRASQDLESSRAGGLYSRTIEELDQRGIADRFLAEGQAMQVQTFAGIPLDISDFPTRHNYGLALWQRDFERILAGWVGELAVPIVHEREVAGFAQDDTGVDVELSDGTSLRADYLVGCDGGRSVVRKAAGIEFAGWDPTTSWLIAEVEMDEQPEIGIRREGGGIGPVDPAQGGGPYRVVLKETRVDHIGEPTMEELCEALVVAYGTDFGVHSPTWIFRFTDMTRQAASYRDGRVLQNTMAQIALIDPDDRHEALRETMTELLGMDEPRRRIAAMLCALDVHYDLVEGHPLLGRRVPDLDLLTADGPLRVFTLLHDARPVLLNLGEPGGLDITPWAHRVSAIDARYAGDWELPVLGQVAAPSAVLIRPDGYVAWVGDGTDTGLRDALTTWFGPPSRSGRAASPWATP